MKKEIKERLLEHLKYLNLNENQFLGIFVYGSQNYGLETKDSDIDSKVITIPTFNELIFNKTKIKEHRLPNGELCIEIPLPHFVNNLKKQNINFLEVLFTKNKIINDKYKNLFNLYFLVPREEISRYDTNKCLNAACGQALHTLHQNVGDGKKFCNALRLYYFILNYSQEKSFKDCIYLDFNTRQMLLDFKEGRKTITIDMVSQLRNVLLQDFPYKKNSIINDSIEKHLEFATEVIIKKSLKGDN